MSSCFSRKQMTDTTGNGSYDWMLSVIDSCIIYQYKLVKHIMCQSHRVVDWLSLLSHSIM